MGQSRAEAEVALLNGAFWSPASNMTWGASGNPAVPGRPARADIADGKIAIEQLPRLAQLLECGLLRGSFVPPAEIRDLRDLTRLRKTLVPERSSQVNRVGKVLELANVKLGSVVSNVMGATGRAILEAMIAGEDDPKALAGLAKGSLRGKRRELGEVVPGLARDHHRFLLRRHLDTIDELDRQIAMIEARILAETTGPFGAALALLESVPGVARRWAEAILAEIGDDMSRFPTAAHLASWARVCPGNHESAGKRKSAKTGRGNAWLRDALSQVAWAASRTKGKLLPGALLPDEGARRRSKKVIVAVQHTMLVAIWHMFTTGSTHEDLGPDHFKRRNEERRKRHHLNQLRRMGVEFEIREAA